MYNIFFKDFFFQSFLSSALRLLLVLTTTICYNKHIINRLHFLKNITGFKVQCHVVSVDFDLSIVVNSISSF